MTAREYLSQIRCIDLRISSKLERVMSLRALAEKAASTLSDTKVSGSPNVTRMEDIILKMVDLEATISADIGALMGLQREIGETIKCVDNPEQQTLLELRYLSFLRWEDIAVRMQYSSQHLFRLHNDALKAVDCQRRELDV